MLLALTLAATPLSGLSSLTQRSGIAMPPCTPVRSRIPPKYASSRLRWSRAALSSSGRADDSGIIVPTQQAQENEPAEEELRLTERWFTRSSIVGNTCIRIRPICEMDSIDLYRTITRHRSELQEIDPTFGISVKSLGSIVTAVRSNIAAMQEARALPLVITANGTLAGEVGFICIDWERKVGYIGYWLSPVFQGKGLMSTAVRDLIDIGFRSLGLDHVDITTRKSNRASKGVAERLGFTRQQIPDGIRGFASKLSGGLLGFDNVNYEVFTLSSPNASTPAEASRLPNFFQRECTRLLSPGYTYTEPI
mmetsp:Transcript_10250/g.20331  ORF Transcript_10250/g.20331 Transcript_10250/m.20331 type:complete len:308 (-) Transcript_10250:166-1089(-)